MDRGVLREIGSFSPSSIGGYRKFKENSLRKQNNALIEFIIGQQVIYELTGNRNQSLRYLLHLQVIVGNQVQGSKITS